MEVVVYTSSSSTYCQLLKDYLSEKGVSFVEKSIDLSEQTKDELATKSNGFLGVPFLVVNKNSKEEKIVGFDKGRIDEVLLK